MTSADPNSAIMFMAAAEDKFQELNKNLQEIVKYDSDKSKASYESSLKTFKKVLVVCAAILCAALLLSWLLTDFCYPDHRRTGQQNCGGH